MKTQAGERIFSTVSLKNTPSPAFPLMFLANLTHSTPIQKSSLLGPCSCLTAQRLFRPLRDFSCLLKLGVLLICSLPIFLSHNQRGYTFVIWRRVSWAAWNLRKRIYNVTCYLRGACFVWRLVAQSVRCSTSSLILLAQHFVSDTRYLRRSLFARHVIGAAFNFVLRGIRKARFFARRLIFAAHYLHSAVFA